MVAIVAVRAFGLGKGVLRYAERLASHDAALRGQRSPQPGVGRARAARPGRHRAAAPGRAALPPDRRRRRPTGPARARPRARGRGRPWSGSAPRSGWLPTRSRPRRRRRAAARRDRRPAATAGRPGARERRTAAARGEVLARPVEILMPRPTCSCAARRGPADALRRRRPPPRRPAPSIGHRLRRGAGGGPRDRRRDGRGDRADVALRAGTLPGPALAVLALTPLALADVVAPLPDAAVGGTPRGPRARQADLTRIPAPTVDRAASAAHAARGVPGRRPGRGLARRGGAQCPSWTSTWRRAAGSRSPGRTGSGKSTVVAALLRTLDPAAGVLRPTAWTSTNTPRTRCARTSPGAAPAPPLRQHPPGEPCWSPRPMPRTPRPRRRRYAGPAWEYGSTRSPTAWTPASASTAGRLRRRAAAARRRPRAPRRAAGARPRQAHRPPRRRHRRRARP